MSTQTSNVPVAAPPPARKRRIGLYILAGVVVVILLAVAGIAWYASTPDFANRVRLKLIATLEQATGGRVELDAFHWTLRNLAFEADGLTIHGLEAANEVPYAHVDRIYVRVKILSFIHPKIDLNYLEADRPVFHLIIYPDGSTNQPTPKTQTSNKSVKDTIFDLKVGRTEIKNGVALINQRALPFDLAANDLGVVVTYSAPQDHYLATLHAADVTAQRGKYSPVPSRLDVSADIGRNTLNVSQLQLQTGDSLLKATATLQDFANPHWTLTAQGKVDVREVMALAPVDGVDRGMVDVDLKGQGTQTQLVLDGRAKVADAAYHVNDVHITGVDVDTALHATEDDLVFSGVRARIRRGGSVDAEMRVAHWLGTMFAKPGTPPTETVMRGTIRAKLHGITLRTTMAFVASKEYNELGFDTVTSGDGSVDWTGDASDLTAKANVTFVPSAQTPDGEVPMTGTLEGTYFQRNGTVQIEHLQAQTPATQFQVSGGLGVYPISRPSTLQVNVETTNLGEFDQALSAFGVSAGGKKGVQALPLRLQGQAQFQGVVSGNLSNPDAKGHLTASNFDLLLPAGTTQPAPAVAPANAPAQPEVSPAPVSSPSPATAPAPERTIHWDALQADAEYSNQLIAVQQVTLTRGKTTIHASGQLHAHSISPRRYAFDDQSAINADIKVQDAALDEVLAIAGQNLPVTGTFNLNAHAGGEIENLNGGGHLSIQGGDAYGEHYRSLNADLKFAGEEIGVSKLVLLQNGAQLTGSGGFGIRTKQFHFQAEGKDFDLSHTEHFKNAKYPVSGVLVFSADGSGTIASPTIHANAHITKIVVGNEKNGSIDVEAHTDHGNLLYTANGRLASAALQVTGQTAISGDYVSQAHATLSNLDVDPFMEMFHVEGVTWHSSIAGDLTVSGPLRQLRQLQGDAQISQLSLSIAGRPLKSEGPLHAQLNNGILRLDPLHMIGENTDFHAQGRMGLFRENHLINVDAQGSVNMKLLQTINPNVTSSGQVTFNMNAAGTLDRPDLTGQVKLTNVAMSFEDFPNGMSQLNGTLEFDQDRLQVKSLTGTTGGGQVSVTGYVTYQQGIYCDVTATGTGIRIRYPTGISSMVNTKLRLQGTQDSLVLGGSVLLTRFTISPNLDFASFAGPSSNIAPPPDPNAFSNRVRLDIHVMSSPDLDFQNSFAKLAGDVDLRVRGTVAQPTVLGHINVTEGSATFAGTKYQLQHGDIYFSNPVRIEPVIDLDATAHVEDYDITIGLHGTPSNLSPTFRSEPPLSQQDIFSLLAMGRTQEEQQIYTVQSQQAGVNTAADALLGGALNATLSNRIQKLFGGGSVKIDPTWVGSIGNSTARITVAQQVSKNATLTYATNINSTAQQLIQAEVNMTPTISVLAVRDESGVFSLMFKVHRRYR
ncbi:translocation/assembly module TamB domain-containing protein [Alloacidobacterium dinghuense]|uniref:Translocation/assembly module TamB domain-containing protein n=1 Tax=Alloacidobacterium dinghuense TaxID=2763107 RepID=A0A7G8BM51_9BACT|nr:translocation/assembly module TamB domain-containing protein [Alloacidobacterium dinghuense]QNI33621.1 translocation/assembly module TamB domain-containing protein [Alloacidobacterium dinghuense]